MTPQQRLAAMLVAMVGSEDMRRMIGAQAREERDCRICNLYAGGEITRSQLAAKFGVSLATVDRALAGLDWKEIKATRQKYQDDEQRDMTYWGTVWAVAG